MWAGQEPFLDVQAKRGGQDLPLPLAEGLPFPTALVKNYCLLGNRTPHQYLIPQGQVLGWLSEKDEVEDWILGEYKPLDLKKGLQISQVEGDGRLTCQGSDIHADLRTHEETQKKPPEVRSGPFYKGDRACETEDMMKERTVVKGFEVQFKPDADQGQGIHHISQYSAV